MNIELVRFDGDNFDAGANLGFMNASSTFVVNKPPHKEGAKWKMTVDGVELTKVE
jgi:UTP-glucose-1-phosphate uridylyltransferase